jgi:hypothetical protein
VAGHAECVQVGFFFVFLSFEADYGVSSTNALRNLKSLAVVPSKGGGAVAGLKPGGKSQIPDCCICASFSISSLAGFLFHLSSGTRVLRLIRCHFYYHHNPRGLSIVFSSSHLGLASFPGGMTRDQYQGSSFFRLPRCGFVSFFCIYL